MLPAESSHAWEEDPTPEPGVSEVALGGVSGGAAGPAEVELLAGFHRCSPRS